MSIVTSFNHCIIITGCMNPPPPSLGGFLPVMAPHIQYMSIVNCINIIMGTIILNTRRRNFESYTRMNSGIDSIHSSLK